MFSNFIKDMKGVWPKGTVGHLVWPMQYDNPKCPHKGYIHPNHGYRCRYCGVKLKVKVN